MVNIFEFIEAIETLIAVEFGKKEALVHWLACRADSSSDARIAPDLQTLRLGLSDF